MYPTLVHGVTTSRDELLEKSPVKFSRVRFSCSYFSVYISFCSALSGLDKVLIMSNLTLIMPDLHAQLLYMDILFCTFQLLLFGFYHE